MSVSVSRQETLAGSGEGGRRARRSEVRRYFANVSAAFWYCEYASGIVLVLIQLFGFYDRKLIGQFRNLDSFVCGFEIIFVSAHT